MSVYKHPDSGIYYTRWQHKGTEYRRSTNTRDRAEAEVEARRLRVEADQAHVDIGPGDLVPFSAADIAEAVSRGATKAHIRALGSKWDVVLRNLPIGIDVRAITYDLVSAYISRRRADGIRGQTIIREVQCLRRALAIARRRGVVTAAAFDWPLVKRDPQDAARTGKLWSKEQVRQFLRELHEDARDEVLFAALTGLRAAEIKRVRPEWVHESKGGFVLVLAAHATKSRTERTVSLPPMAMQIIRRRVAKSPRDPFVFSQANHRKARVNASINLKLSHVVTLRDMRHTFASLAMFGSGDLVGVQRALGHRDLKVTERYLSSTLERVHGVGNAVQSALGRISQAGSVKSKRARKPPKPRENKERETRFELATFSLGSYRAESTSAKLLDIGVCRTPVIPGVCGGIPDQQVGSAASLTAPRRRK